MVYYYGFLLLKNALNLLVIGWNEYINSTFSYALRDFISIIIEKFLTEKIIFPSTEFEINKITSGFKKLVRISNVIGAIDGSHIPIKAPHLFSVDYFNRKGFYSIVL